MNRRLQALATAPQECAPPYEFAEFQRRAAARAMQPVRNPHRTVSVLRVAAVAAPLALALAILMTTGGVSRQPAAPAPAEVFALDIPQSEPALVHAGTTGTVIDLEDRIAWFDALLSQAPAAGLPVEDRMALQSGRTAMADSLQRVRYAQTLLAY